MLISMHMYCKCHYNQFKLYIKNHDYKMATISFHFLNFLFHTVSWWKLEMLLKSNSHYLTISNWQKKKRSREGEGGREGGREKGI